MSRPTPLATNESAAVQPLGRPWFKLEGYSVFELREYTVTKSTSQTVWYRRKDWNNKETGETRQERKGGRWFDSKRAALEHWRASLERKEQATQAEYSRAVERLKKFNAQYARELG